MITPTDLKRTIEHFFIIMENRSFDHMLGFRTQTEAQPHALHHVHDTPQHKPRVTEENP